MRESHLPTIEQQKEFWNWHWQHWQERNTINEWKDKRHAAIVVYLGDLSLFNAKLLDVGCGPGYYTKDLVEFGEVTGIDLSDDAISAAKAKYPDITFYAGNLYEFPLPAGNYDVVVSQEVFDHVENQQAFLERVARLLKSGGYLILSCTNKFVMDRLGEGDFPQQPSSHIARYLSMNDLKRSLMSHFNVLRTKSVIPMGHRGILRVVNSYRLNNVVGRVIPRRYLESLKERAGFGYQIIALAQKKS